MLKCSLNNYNFYHISCREAVAVKNHLSHEFKFNSDAKTLNLGFFTEQTKWTLESITGTCHNSGKMEVIIPENLFGKCNSNQTMIIDSSERSTENVIKEKSLETIRLLNVGRIERHPFMNDFTIKIVYKFDDDEREFITEYDIQVRFPLMLIIDQSYILYFSLFFEDPISHKIHEYFQVKTSSFQNDSKHR